ncbi:MAG: hypothetical protein KJO07_25890 [Deltaproteobacteria bacterium]|nr:hypothetical protein [Deltaproteobacteria bacterium]
MRRTPILKMFVLATALPLALVGCGSEDGSSSGPEAEELDETGTHNTYVLDSLQVPTSPSEANALGLNIDFDDQDIPDNQLGKILSTLASAAGGDFDISTSLAETIATGDIILLSSIQATDLSNAAGAGMWVYIGDEPSRSPCTGEEDTTCGKHLDGQTGFAIKADSPRNALITGQIAGGKFDGGPGTVRLELPLVGDTPLVLDLIGAQAKVTVGANGLQSGRLGGAVTEDALRTDVLPALQQILVDVAGEDCVPGGETCCTPESTGELLYDLFDEDGSCDISLTELENNSLISTLLAPDLDLLDEGGNFNPNSDGVLDSLSLGIGFSAVGATFSPPVQ